MQMLDCIEAFHRHGYVHRDIKASNFAMADSTNPAKRCVLSCLALVLLLLRLLAI